MHRGWIGRAYRVAWALAFAGSALKIYQWYHSRPLWLDEEMVLLNVRDRPFSELFGSLWLNQVAPVGWLALQRVIVTMIGTDDRAVRAVPVLFGIATLWVCFWIGRRWMTPSSAAIFVGLCGIGQWMTFYALEAKPYSADAFWTILLLGLTVWAAEPANERPLSLQRTAIWWSVAALGHWFAFAAAFVMPGCALVLCAVAWLRAGQRYAAIVLAQAAIWIVSFAAHYAFSIQTASADEFLRAYWSAGFPPIGGRVSDSLVWLFGQAQPIAAHPGGTEWWIPYWMTVFYGTAILLMRRRVLGSVILSVLVSAFLVALLHLVPLANRLALWTIPAMYAAVAVATGDAFERILAIRSWRTVAAIALVPFSVIALMTSGDIVRTGRARMNLESTNHGFDDGRAVRLLTQEYEPGDVWLTTRLGLPAIWWYGNINIADPGAGSRFRDGSAVFEVRHVWLGTEGCRGRTQLRALEESLTGVSRAAVYLGFDSKVPPGLQELVLDDLSRLGTRVLYSPVGSEGVVAVYDLRQRPNVANADTSTMERDRANQPGRLAGCVGLLRAQRW